MYHSTLDSRVIKKKEYLSVSVGENGRGSPRRDEERDVTQVDRVSEHTPTAG